MSKGESNCLTITYVYIRGAPDLEFSNPADRIYRIRTKIPAEIPAGFETRHFGINWDSLAFKNSGLNYKFYGF